MTQQKSAISMQLKITNISVQLTSFDNKLAVNLSTNFEQYPLLCPKCTVLQEKGTKNSFVKSSALDSMTAC